ncbi:hypothetical protein KUCAC02_026659, partial [Chaenocephalus aceratus]
RVKYKAGRTRGQKKNGQNVQKTEYFRWIATNFYSIKPKHSTQEASGGGSGGSSAVGLWVAVCLTDWKSPQ